MLTSFGANAYFFLKYLLMFFRITLIVSDRSSKREWNSPGCYSGTNEVEMTKKRIFGAIPVYGSCFLQKRCYLVRPSAVRVIKVKTAIAIEGDFSPAALWRAERKQSERIEVSFWQNVKTRRKCAEVHHRGHRVTQRWKGFWFTSFRWIQYSVSCGLKLHHPFVHSG